MSETEHVIGKAILCNPMDGQSVEGMCKEIMDRRGVTMGKYNDTYAECLTDSLYNEYVIAGGELYLILEKKDYDYEDICEAKREDDESFSFHLKWYNGGAGFAEVFESAVIKLNKGELK